MQGKPAFTAPCLSDPTMLSFSPVTVELAGFVAPQLEVVHGLVPARHLALMDEADRFKCDPLLIICQCRPPRQLGYIISDGTPYHSYPFSDPILPGSLESQRSRNLGSWVLELVDRPSRPLRS